EHRATLLVLVGTALLALRYVGFSDDLVPGILAACPVLAAGLAALRWQRLEPDRRALAVFVGAYAGAVIATQYPQGGGTEWGGRFLAPVLVAGVALAVPALVGLARPVPETPVGAGGEVTPTRRTHRALA